jgi:peptidoglycan hydrolase-like protein with peptidoglycan-binding domain
LSLRQRRPRGADGYGADGRAGLDTLRAAKAFQQKVGKEPADGYPGIRLLARLRQGS